MRFHSIERIRNALSKARSWRGISAAGGASPRPVGMKTKRAEDECLKGGFTIIEMMVAVALSSIILLMIYSMHRSIIFSIKDMTGISEFYENINLVSHRIDRDISSALIVPGNKKLFLIGGTTSYDAGKSELHFVTVMKSDQFMGTSLKSRVSGADVREIGYFLRKDPQISDLFFLVRREAPQYDDAQDSGGTETVILENVEDVRFEFIEAGSWESKWDTKDTGRFPRAVRTTLKVRNYRTVSETFSFVTYLQMVKVR